MRNKNSIVFLINIFFLCACSAPVENPSESYEIVRQRKDGTASVNMTVFVKTPSAETVKKINDYLVNLSRNNYHYVNIDYFDDKLVAEIYFEKQSDPNISEEEKDRLFKHYIASMVLNKTTNFKQFFDIQKKEIIANY